MLTSSREITALARELSRLGPLHPYSHASLLERRIPRELIAPSFMLPNPVGEPRYFGGSIQGQAVLQYPHLQGSFQKPLPLEDLTKMQALGSVTLSPGVVLAQVQSLQERKILPDNDTVPIHRLDDLLWEVLEQSSESKEQSSSPETNAGNNGRASEIHIDGIPFREIYRTYRPLVEAIAMSISRDPIVADEIVNTVFLKVYRFRDSYTPGTNLKGWIGRITGNAAVDHYNNEKKRRRIEDEPEDEIIAMSISAYAQRPPHEAILLQRERERQVHIAIERYLNKNVPPTFRGAAVLRHVDGLAYHEIAKKLEVPIGTVMSRLGRAKKAMLKAGKPQFNQYG